MSRQIFRAELDTICREFLDRGVQHGDGMVGALALEVLTLRALSSSRQQLLDRAHAKIQRLERDLAEARRPRGIVRRLA